MHFESDILREKEGKIYIVKLRNAIRHKHPHISIAKIMKKWSRKII